MRLILTGLEKLESDESISPKIEGLKRLQVRACAICRTDAKIWSQGHRDLSLPRVLGHEFVVEDETGHLYAVWPGRNCGSCHYCQTGRENLCDKMKITGFHFDGGFAEYADIPEFSLVPMPISIPANIGCFAEPTGCVLNGLEKIRMNKGERIIIYGGGTLGLITALVCQSRGGDPVVIEKNEEKIKKIRPFLDATHIECCKDTTSSEYDLVINTCPDPAAFSLGVVKLAKGGRYSFFSGLKKNEYIETNLLNLMHYKEIELIGSYGLTRKNMSDALVFIEKELVPFTKMIEKVIHLESVPDFMKDVMSGRPLKYIIDFSKVWSRHAQTCETESFQSSELNLIHRDKGDSEKKTATSNISVKSDILKSVLESIRPPSEALKSAAHHKIDNKTKPLGSLGRLEDLALQMSLIQNSLTPAIHRKSMFVFAGDHGITEEGISAFPTEVTVQMVKNFLNQGAAINVLCRHHKIDIHIVDMGVNADFEPHPYLFKRKIRKGTNNFAIQEAMTMDEAFKAIENGIDVFKHEHEKKSIDIVGMGEMGIGNTTSASSIISCITGISPSQATGRGTGVDDKGLEHKAEIIEKALKFHHPDPENGFEILMKVGGFEIAGMVGAIFASASKNTAVVLDGLISTASGLLAYLICPKIKGYLISGHRSVEKAQNAALDYMGLEPLIDFNMRLGEGTGAALAINIAEAACKIMIEMASFDNAGVSKRN